MDEKLIKLFQQLAFLLVVVFVIGAIFNWNSAPKKTAKNCGSSRWNKGNNDQGKFGGRYGPSGVTAPMAEGLTFFPPIIGPQTRY